MDKYMKHFPSFLLYLYSGKILLCGTSISDSLNLLVIAAVYVTGKYFVEDQKAKLLEAQSIELGKQIKDLTSRIDKIKDSVDGIQLAKGIRPNVANLR